MAAIATMIALALVTVAMLAGGRLVRRPADARGMVRLAALSIILLTVALLAPSTVQDSGWAVAAMLHGVPVVAALLPLLAQRLGRAERLAELVAAIVLFGWGLLLALGLSAAFLPPVLLYLISALGGLAPRPPRAA